MSIQQAEVLYTFEPEEETEIAIYEGETVRIFNEDIGEGWCQGENIRGDQGIFPQNYIRITGPETVANAVVPTISPATTANNSVQQSHSSPLKSTNDNIYDEAPPDDDWGNEYATQQTQNNNPPAYNTEQTTQQPTPTAISSSTTNNAPPSSYTEDDESVAGFLGRYLNRFTYFAKSQAEDYILGTLQASQKNHAISDGLSICKYGDDGPIWRVANGKFNIRITNYCKGDARGLFAPQLYYQLAKDQEPGKEVKRKYEHFEWLMECFKKKYPVAALPVLPQKVVIEEAALTRQVKLLNIWADQISNSPILQQSKLVEHFMTIDDKKLFTKARKQAEQDKVILGANFKVVEIDHDAILSISNQGDLQLQRSKKLHDAFTSNFEGITRAVSQNQDVCIKYVSPTIKSLETSFERLGNALTDHRTFGTNSLGEAFQQASHIFKDINADLTTQPAAASQDLNDKLWVHKAKLQTWPNLFNINELSVDKFKDAMAWKSKKDQQNPGQPSTEPNYNDKLVEIVKARGDRVVTIIQAEINHHTTELVKDSKLVMQEWLEKQIAFHQQLVDKYSQALQSFNSVKDI